MNTNREDLIRSIEKARVRGVVVPTDVFGRKVFVKTSKHDLVAQIRKEFNETESTNLRMRIDETNNVAIVEPSKGGKTNAVIPVTLLPETEQPKRPMRTRGRPKGSKNRTKDDGGGSGEPQEKPKQEAAPASTE